MFCANALTIFSVSAECLTAPGAGAGLQWTILIDGQQNQEPITSYAVPTLTSVVYPNTSVVPTGVNGISTDGNVTFQLNGLDFGPHVVPLVQWVRVASSVAQYAVTSYTVISDSQLNVTVGPGVGKNLTFNVRVAGQDSPVSAVTFDYLSPVIYSMSPKQGPTFSATGFPVQITGKNFGLSAGATVVVRIGNSADGTVSQPLPALPVYPPGDDGTPKQRVNETVQFQLPPGVGVNRTVQVSVYPSTYSSLAVSSNPVASGAASLFSYQPPVLTSVVSGVLLNTTADEDIAMQLLGPVSMSIRVVPEDI